MLKKSLVAATAVFLSSCGDSETRLSSPVWEGAIDDMHSLVDGTLKLYEGKPSVLEKQTFAFGGDDAVFSRRDVTIAKTFPKRDFFKTIATVTDEDGQQIGTYDFAKKSTASTLFRPGGVSDFLTNSIVLPSNVHTGSISLKYQVAQIINGQNAPGVFNAELITEVGDKISVTINTVTAREAEGVCAVWSSITELKSGLEVPDSSGQAYSVKKSFKEKSEIVRNYSVNNGSGSECEGLHSLRFHNAECEYNVRDYDVTCAD